MSALLKLVCKCSRLLPGAALGAVAASLSANSIALPRWAAASLNAERRKAWSPALPHHSIAGWAPRRCLQEIQERLVEISALGAPAVVVPDYVLRKSS